MAIQKPISHGESTGGFPQVRQYQLLRTLGSGGMGVVYEAFHLHLRRRVALKVLSPQLAASPSAVQRFEREMAAIGQLSHPNIVQALDAGVDQTTHYLAMEFVDGVNIESLIQRVGELRVEDACEIIRQAAQGLAHAHSFGIVHRDVKPSNLLLSKSGEVKVADLGLARFHELLEQESLTAHGAVLGTYDYMSPEQAQGVTVEPQADLYSLGATLFRLLTGHPVFAPPEFRSVAQKLSAHLSQMPPRVAALRTDIPAALDDLVHRLLAKTPAERPSSAQEVIDVLAPLSRQASLTTLAESVASSPLHERTTQSFYSGPTKTFDTPSVSAHGKAEVHRRRRAPLWLGVGGLAVVAILAGVWHYATRPLVAPGVTPLASLPDTKEASSTPVFEDLASKDLALLRWYPLLNREPRKTIWPTDALSSISFERTESRLHASCADIGVLSFGRAELDGYRLRMDLHQNRWVGGIGVIFGLRKHPQVPGGFMAQGILFHLAEVREDPHRMALRRAKLVFTPRPEGDFRMQRTEAFDSIIGTPSGVSETLEIEVAPTGLSHIRWAGSDVAELCSSEINDAFEPEDYRGDFGVYLSGADLNVSSVQLMPLFR